MNHKEKERLAVVETKVEDVQKDVTEVRIDVKDILTNHLPHLQEQIAVNKIKIAVIAGSAAFLATFLSTKLLELLL